MRIRTLVLGGIVVAVSACAEAGPAEPGSEPSDIAEIYLGEALDVLEYNSVYRNEIDWASFRSDAFAELTALGARQPADVHPVVEGALERLGDGHSFFRAVGPSSAPERNLVGEASSTPSGEPDARLVAPGVGYVDVAVVSAVGTQADDFAALYHELIEGVESDGRVCRWVVDLRGNTGGNMWPMVAAVGPILGEDTIGYFVDADSVTSSWYYEGGRSGIDDDAIVEVDAPYLRGARVPNVAVLTDRRTASSGEAVAIAFRHRDGARSFGEPTWGVSTANAAFPLSDGSVIFLTVATMADRSGTVYGEELWPDALVDGGTKTRDIRTDRVLRTAVAWLRGQPCS